jgi:hypothetical protein
MNITVVSTVSPDTYPITVTGTRGSSVHSTTVNLTARPRRSDSRLSILQRTFLPRRRTSSLRRDAAQDRIDPARRGRLLSPLSAEFSRNDLTSAMDKRKSQGYEI